MNIDTLKKAVDELLAVSPEERIRRFNEAVRKDALERLEKLRQALKK